jgi:hypothetical protein
MCQWFLMLSPNWQLILLYNVEEKVIQMVCTRGDKMAKSDSVILENGKLCIALYLCVAVY